jgi:hypothetical protein
MNNQFNPLPRHGTPLFSPDERHDFGSTNGSSVATRRKFLKKTGGATAATSLAWLASSRMAGASGGEDSLSPNDKTNEHVTKTTGDESPANPDTSIKGYVRVFRKRIDGTKGAELFNIEPYWQFSWKVTLGGGSTRRFS